MIDSIDKLYEIISEARDDTLENFKEDILNGLHQYEIERSKMKNNSELNELKGRR